MRLHCRPPPPPPPPLSLPFHPSRLTQWWSLLPGLPLVPVTVGLVREGSKWALVDAGLRDGWRQPHASHLLAALRSTIPAGDTLAGIAREWHGLLARRIHGGDSAGGGVHACSPHPQLAHATLAPPWHRPSHRLAPAVTHTHEDHVGALPLLLEAYPGAQVLVHELERAQLLQGWQRSQPWALALRWAGLAGPQPVAVSRAGGHAQGGSLRVAGCRQTAQPRRLRALACRLYVPARMHPPPSSADAAPLLPASPRCQRSG